jgi:hypothetical protein
VYIRRDAAHRLCPRQAFVSRNPMSNPFGALRSRYDRITISTVHVAFALSLLLHLAALWEWPMKIRMRSSEDVRMGEQGGTLAVRLAMPPTPPAPPAPSADVPPMPERRLVMPKSAPKSAAPPPSAAPRLLAVERQARSAAVAPPPPRPTEAERPAAGDDLAAYIEARRRSREPSPATQPSPAAAPSAPAESEQARQNREAAARLGFSATPTFGSNKNLGGGMFQVRRVNIERAELAFYGWNKFINRISLQVFEVPRGSNPSTQIAVVRKIIEIIREQESDKFIWESLRLRREITLSARPADNAGLEAFMMEEFFSEARLR